MGINKKGGIVDLFVFMILAFALALVSVIMLYIANTTETELLSHASTIQAAVGPGENATTIIEGTFGNVPGSFQSLKWITGMLMIGMILSILITSFLIRVNPIWLVPYIIIWIVAIIFSAPLSNAYETVSQDPTLASTFTGFWAQNYIFANLPLWIIVIGGFAGVLMVISLVRQSQYGGYE